VKRTTAAALLAIVAPMFTPTSARGQELEAIRLEATPAGEALAEGQVRLRLGGCELSATRLQLAPLRGLRAEQVCLSAGTTRLEAHRLKIGPRGELEAEHVEAVPCGCPGARRPLLSFRARRARLAAGGHRLFLHSPVVRLLGLPVAALPFPLPVPLRPGTSGLLFPRLGYSGRDGVRVEQGVYIAPGERLDLLLSGGWIQERGAVARARLRAAAAGKQARVEVELHLTGLHEEGRLEPWRGAVKGTVVAAGHGWALGLRPDLVSDHELLADLEQAPERVFARYLRSRAWAWGALAGLWAATRADLFQDRLLPLLRRSGLVQARVGLAPLRFAGPLLLDLDAGLSLVYPAVSAGSEGGSTTTLLDLGPALWAGHRLGPVWLSAGGRFRLLSSWGGASTGGGGRQQRLGLGRLEASIPLDRVYLRSMGDLIHRIEPLAALSAGGIHERPIPEWGGQQPREGVWALSGLRSFLWQRHPGGGTSRLAEATLQLEAPLTGGGDHHWLLAGEILLAPIPRHLKGRVSAAWSPDAGRLTELQARACGRAGSRDSVSVEACGGYHRQRAASQGQLFGLAGTSWLRDNPTDLKLGPGAEADQLTGSLQVRFGGHAAGARLAGDLQRGELSYGSLWFDLSPWCGCLRTGLTGAWRAGQRWPDLLLRLALVGGSWPGC
jgi:hypothetical protein